MDQWNRPLRVEIRELSRAVVVSSTGRMASPSFPVLSTATTSCMSVVSEVGSAIRERETDARMGADVHRSQDRSDPRLRSRSRAAGSEVRDRADQPAGPGRTPQSSRGAPLTGGRRLRPILAEIVGASVGARRTPFSRSPSRSSTSTPRRCCSTISRRWTTRRSAAGVRLLMSSSARPPHARGRCADLEELRPPAHDPGVSTTPPGDGSPRLRHGRARDGRRPGNELAGRRLMRIERVRAIHDGKTASLFRLVGGVRRRIRGDRAGGEGGASWRSRVSSAARSRSWTM